MSEKENSKELTSIRVSKWAVELLNNLQIEIWWVDLSWQDNKIKHLIWFYKNYKNNNWK